MSHLASVERLDPIRGSDLAAGDWVLVDGGLRCVERVQRTRRGTQVYLASMPAAGIEAAVILIEDLQVMKGRKGRCKVCGVTSLSTHWQGCPEAEREDA